jgi:hypothetical protein
MGSPTRSWRRRFARDSCEPLDQAIELINDAESFLGGVDGFLGPAQDLLEEFLP